MTSRTGCGRAPEAVGRMACRRAALLWLAALAPASGCRGPAALEATGQQTALRSTPQLHRLENRTGGALRLWRAVRDGWEELRSLGRELRVDLWLQPGRYAIALEGRGPAVPLPVLPAELGYRPRGIRDVEVWPWPDERQGFVWIPPGLSVRGDALGVGQEDERPVDVVELPGFWLARHETTNIDYARFLNEVGRDAVDPRWIDFEGAKCGVRWDEQREIYVSDAPWNPVVTVSWRGAMAYCEWLTETAGERHRLPAEAEWEKAARGPGSRVYSYGDTFQTRAANQESGRLRSVGSFAVSAFGLYDMTGNAFEWTGDRYGRHAYSGVAGQETAADEVDAFRVLRGGSFVLDGIFLRNAMRMRLRPTVRADDVGFRVLRENRDARFGPVPAAAR